MKKQFVFHLFAGILLLAISSQAQAITIDILSTQRELYAISDEETFQLLKGPTTGPWADTAKSDTSGARLYSSDVPGSGSYTSYTISCLGDGVVNTADDPSSLAGYASILLDVSFHLDDPANYSLTGRMQVDRGFAEISLVGPSGTLFDFYFDESLDDTGFLTVGDYYFHAIGDAYLDPINLFDYPGTPEDFMLLNFDFTLTSVSPVPEPATMLLLGSGLIGLAGFRRKFRKG